MADRNLRIRMLLEAGDKVTRPLRDIANGSSRAAQALRGTRDRLKEIDRAQADVGGFKELRSGLRATEQAMQAAQTRVGQLAQKMQATENPTRAMTREFEKAKREEQQLTSQHQADSRELQELSLRLHTAGADVNDLAGYQRRLRTAAVETNRELQEQERRLQVGADRQRRFGAARDRFTRGQGVATGMAAGGAAALGTGVVMARPILSGIAQAQEFQSGMTDIAQKADLTRKQADKMGASLLVAARAANQMPADLQKGVDTLSGFGLDPTKATQMMKPIGRAATAYKAEINDLSAAAFAANDNLKVPVEQTGKVIDIMAAAGKAGAFEVKDMAGAFPSLTAAYQGLKQTGVSAVADLAAAAQIARKGAGDSASAATNLENVIQKIASPATLKAFAKFGVDVPSALKKAYSEGKTPLEAIAELTNKTLKGDLGKLGFLFEDAQVQKGLRPLIQNMEEYRRIRSEALGASGTTDTDFAERMKDSAEQTKALKVNAAALAISLGNTLLPTVNAMASRASAFANRLSAWSQRHPGLTRAIVLTAGGLSALFVVLGIGAIALAGIVGPMYLFAAAATYTEMALLPIIGIALAIVAGIALLAGAAYLIYSNWGAIGSFFSNMWTGIETRFSTASDAVVGVFRGMWSGVRSLFSMSLLDVYNGIAYFVGYALGSLYRFGSAAYGWLTGTLPGLLSSGWSAAWGMFTGAISASWSWLTTQLPVKMANGWNVAWNFFKSAMRAAFITLPTMFFDFGTMIIQGLWNGIKSAPGKLWAAGVSMAKSLSTGFAKASEIKSPSRVFMALGGHIVGGLNKGLDGAASQPVSRLQQLSQNMAKAIAVGTAVPAMAMASPGTGSAAGSASSASASSVRKYEIHLHAAPGMDEAKMMDMLERKIVELQRRDASDDLARFADKDEF